jgi:hypothetical protein
MPLAVELQTFDSMRADLLSNHSGKFALIKGEKFLGAFDSAENAYAEGVAQFGKEPFLVKRIAAEDEVYRNQALALGLINAHI